MQGVRIQPTANGKFLVDVVCDCGNNGLLDQMTGEPNFKHPVELGTGEIKVLICGTCQSEYVMYTQSDHVHVTNLVLPTNDKILFYGGEWYIFSNFSSFRVRWRDTDWMTSEHAYQAAKFDDREIVELIENAPSAHDARKIAHAYEHKVVENWNDLMIGIMEEIVRAKFAQHPYIQKKLRETGDRDIVEDSPTDSFWGRGPYWKGFNWLGRIWMKLRSEMLAGYFSFSHK